MPTFYGPPSDGTVIPEQLETALAADIAAPGSKLRDALDDAGLGSGLSAGDVTSSSFLVRGVDVALGGDSITDGAGSTNTTVDSYYAHLQKILGGARANIIEHGVPGESAAGLLARMPAIIASEPGAFVMMIGTNPSSDLAKYKADVTAILDLTRDARIPTVINLVPPKGAGATDAATHAERANIYNLFLRHIAAARGIPVADVFGALVDPATGFLRTEFDGDGTHPTPAGHLAIAKVTAEALDKVLPRALPLVFAPGAPGLITNPLMAATTVGGTPTGWAQSLTPPADAPNTTASVDPVDGDGLVAGQWMKMSIDATARTSSATMQRHHNLTTNPAPGNLVLITAQIKTEPGSEDRCALQWADGGTMLGMVVERFGVNLPGMVAKVYEVPAGGISTTARIRFSVTAPAGQAHTCYVGAVQAYNLTALGLTEIV